MANISKTDLNIEIIREDSCCYMLSVNYPLKKGDAEKLRKDLTDKVELADLILKAYGSDNFDDAYAVHEKIQKMLI